MMNGKPSERGMATLTALMFFIVAAVLIVASTVSRNLYVARDLSRDLFEKQADWLAESAVERAILQLEAVSYLPTIDPQEYSESIAPVYVSLDPLREEGDANNQQSVIARYGFRIQSSSIESATHSYQITGFCQIPYRKTTIVKNKTYLAVYFSQKGWQVTPYVTE